MILTREEAEVAAVDMNGVGEQPNASIWIRINEDQGQGQGQMWNVKVDFVSNDVHVPLRWWRHSGDLRQSSHKMFRL